MSNGTPATPYTLSSSSALSDDYIMTADVLVNVESTSPVGVFQNADGVSEALFVRADGVLCQLALTPGASAAGWSATPVGTTSGVTQAAAGVHNDGSIHGFYTDAANLYHITLSGSAWSDSQTLPLCSGLAITNNFITGELIAYGVDGNGNLQLVRDQNGTWGANSIVFPAGLTGTQPLLMFTDAGDDWVMAVVTAGNLAIYQGSATQIASGPMNVETSNPIEQVIVAYWTNNSALFLFTDNKNNLYTNVGSASNAVLIPGATVVQGAGVVDLNNMIHLYSVDTNGMISVLHQTDWSSGPVWAPVIPLDIGFQLLFTDANPQDSTSFFAVDVEDTIWSYVLDPVAQTWTSSKAQMPSSESYNIPTYRTQVTVVDANGNPAPDLQLTVVADSLSAIIVQGTFLPVGPNLPASVTTNATGQVTLTTVATAIASPQLTFTADALTPPTAINPAADVHTYLSGQGTLNPGTSSALPQFSATTLANAQVSGQPLAPGAASHAALARAAASGISTMFQVNVGGGTTAAKSTAADTSLVGFILDFTDPNNPTYTPITNEEEFQRRRALVLGTADNSWWDSIEGFFVDIWQGIQTAAISVAKWVVHTIDATVDMVVQIGNEIQNIVGLAINGLEDVVSVVHSIFVAIGAEIEKLIDWLKMLFDWQAIVDTKNALASALSQAFPYLGNIIVQQGPNLVNGFFSTLESDVTNAFKTMIAQVEGQSLGQLAGSSSGSSAMFRFGVLSPAAAGAVSQSDLSTLSTVQNNWLFEKIESYFGGGPEVQFVANLVTPLETLNTAFGTVVDDFKDALTKFASFFETALTDPSQLSTIGVADLLTAAKDVCLAVLAFFDGIIVALLEVLANAVDAVGQILTASFEIPIISSIVNDIASILGIDLPPLSITDIFCFAFAIPVTIFYKLKNGVDTEPFPGGGLPSNTLKASALDGGSVATAMTYTAVGIAALWALFDTGLDAVPDVDIMVFKIIDVIAPTLLGIFTWPGGIPFTTVSLDTAEDKANFANWITSWADVALDIALLVAGAISWAPESTIARYVDPQGKIAMSAFGGINLVAGIVASSLGASGGAIAANILGPLPVLTQFLRLDSIVEGTEEISTAIKLVIDFFTGEGFAIATATTA